MSKEEKWEKLGITIIRPLAKRGSGYYVLIPEAIREAYNLLSGDYLEVEIKRIRRLK